MFENIIFFGTIFGAIAAFGSYIYTKHSKGVRDDFGFGDTSQPKPKGLDEHYAKLFKGAQSIPIFGKFEINYQDGSGETTQRVITASRIFRTEQGSYLQAYCHLRNEPRTFLLNRISLIIDVETGEIYKSINDLNQSDEQIAKTELGRFHLFLRDHEPELVVLMHVARSDGRMVASEKAILVEFIHSMTNSSISPEIISKRVSAFSCTPDDFEKSLNILANKPLEIRTRIFDAAVEVMNADGKIKPQELEVIDKLKIALNIEE